MIGRRSILKAILGAPAAASSLSGLGPKRAAHILGLGGALSAGEVVEAAGECAQMPEPWNPSFGEMNRQFYWDVVNPIYWAKVAPERNLPPHISSMRSWSPTFRASQHARETALIRLAEFQMRHADKSVTGRLMRALGLQDDISDG